VVILGSTGRNVACRHDRRCRFLSMSKTPLPVASTTEDPLPCHPLRQTEQEALPQARCFEKPIWKVTGSRKAAEISPTGPSGAGTLSRCSVSPPCEPGRPWHSSERGEGGGLSGRSAGILRKSAVAKPQPAW